jgi:hypothetical protein
MVALRRAADEREIAARLEADQRAREDAARREAASIQELSARLDAEFLQERTASSGKETLQEPAPLRLAELEPMSDAPVVIENRALMDAESDGDDVAQPRAIAVGSLPNDPSTSARHPLRASPEVMQALAAQQEAEAARKAEEARKQPEKYQRKAPRIASRMPATIHVDGMPQTMACTMRDRSPSGAQLEFPPDRYGAGLSEIAVGDRVTLMFQTSQERTSVPCTVQWVNDRRCGVRFVGQFQTQVIKTRRMATKEKEKAAAEKATAAKADASKPAKPMFKSSNTLFKGRAQK